MGKEFDLHRHDMFSTFDGFGRPSELAELAKELGYDSLCTTNHGNTNGLIQTYKACKEKGLKAILGVEGYFLPKYKEKDRGTHLILIAKNLQGYENMNTIQFEGEKRKYYNPIWDFKILKKYHEGLICTSACVAGYLAKCIAVDKIKQAKMFIQKMVDIFGDDFYIEIQPYPVSDKGLQEKVNVKSIELAQEMGVKCILTSDSHRGRKEDWPTYLKMHQIAGHDEEWVKGSYYDRYMPKPGDLAKRFVRMHSKDFGKQEAIKMAKQMTKNLAEIEDKCELNYLDELQEILPKLEDVEDTFKVLINNVKSGLKERGKYNKKYIARAKEELDVIKYHGFEDYFLMVQDYVNWAKDQGIAVGPGRGSACNSIVCYALKITEVDSIYFDLEFRRFLMKERKKMPDIDIDFETARRGEVIEYLLDKYEGHSAQVCSYGLYKVDNLINDLAKVCGLLTDKSVDETVKANKETIRNIKSYINSYIDEGFLDEDGLRDNSRFDEYNELYDDIMVHFLKMYQKIRYIGTHAAGVAITGDNLLRYSAIKIDKKSGRYFTSYDLVDIEDIGVIKFDILGLNTMSQLKDCREATGTPGFDISMIEDPQVIDAFSRGDCDGVFQLEKASVQQLLVNIHTNNFNDVVAATAMNRPGPLKQRMPERYAANKEAAEIGEEGERIPALDHYLQKTYGTIVYQEQIMRMAVEIAGMTWDEAHAITKMKIGVDKFNWYFEGEYPKFEANFVKGCRKLGIVEEQAKDIFKKFYDYSFNEGHSVGYTLISAEQMYYKVYYPSVYWYSKIKYAKNDVDFSMFCENAVADGAVVFLPHVNYSRDVSSLRKVEGEYAIQQGLTTIKGVGDVAAQVILEERQNNGVFISLDDFLDRMEENPKGSKVNKKVKELLLEVGALDFNKKKYIKKVKLYNSALWSRANRKGKIN